jgi:hypothetical protein
MRPVITRRTVTVCIVEPVPIVALPVIVTV